MRYIVVPKNAEAVNKLEYNIAAPEEFIEIVLSEDDFNRLEMSGFFSFLNNLVDVNIDDYEDDVIEGRDKIQKVLNYIHIFNIDSQRKFLINNIERLFKEAFLRNTAVYFYF
ncbi:hypothetical protein [Sphingobacterium endophyticum]|uniref:hypothetical protein n=1 Tax=Sphingobacterium endophyticum TaxID=2546448 RepID=UPI0012E314D9|nr:hypothetical protein [Sphingobacterium endophyticum]